MDESAKVTKATNMVTQIDQAIARIIERTERANVEAQAILNALSGYSIPLDAPELAKDEEGIFHRFYRGTGQIERNLAHLEELLTKIQEEIS